MNVQIAAMNDVFYDNDDEISNYYNKDNKIKIIEKNNLKNNYNDSQLECITKTNKKNKSIKKSNILKSSITDLKDLTSERELKEIDKSEDKLKKNAIKKLFIIDKKNKNNPKDLKDNPFFKRSMSTYKNVLSRLHIKIDSNEFRKSFNDVKKQNNNSICKEFFNFLR